MYGTFPYVWTIFGVYKCRYAYHIHGAFGIDLQNVHGQGGGYCWIFVGYLLDIVSPIVVSYIFHLRTFTKSVVSLCVHGQHVEQPLPGTRMS